MSPSAAHLIHTVIPQADEIPSETFNLGCAFCSSTECISLSGGGGGGGQRVKAAPPAPLGDPSAQGLVLSKLCQPCNDLQQRTVSLLIGRPSP